MNIQPYGKKMLLEIITEETTTASGLILTDNTTGDYKPHDIIRCKIKYAGPECRLAKIGDIVLVEYCYTRPFVYKNMEYKIVQEPDLVGVIKDAK